MNYFKLLKFDFKSPARIGMPSGTGLDEVLPFFRADTIFSAFCHALNDTESRESFERYLKEFEDSPKFLISDMLPFINGELCFPKPFYHDHGLHNKKEDSNTTNNNKKKLKSIKYLTLSNLKEYIRGNNFDSKIEAKLDHHVKEFVSFKVSVFRNYSETEEGKKLENKLYSVNAISYNPHNEDNKEVFFPCLIVKYEDEREYKLFKKNLDYLSEKFIGIGGKRSIGYGQFEFRELEESAFNLNDLKSILTSNGSEKNNILLNASRPSKNEAKEALKTNNLRGYQIVERKGFIESPYWRASPIKKRSCYMFDSGSVFKSRFKGCLIDVSPDKFPHKVYRYGYSMFAGVT